MKILKKTLLIGCGYWGKNWAKTLYRLSELGAVCDPRPEVLVQLKLQYPDIRLYTEVSEALNDTEIDTVVIATPVTTHLPVATECLKKGLHVLVEKPLTLSASESQQLVDLAQAQNCLLAVGHILMHHPALLHLQRLIRQGVLGDILSVQCTRVNLGKIRNEENVWWSLAPHDLSILSLLLEEPYELVSASKMCLLGRPSIEDSVSASFVTPSGKCGTVQVSWLHPFKKHETLVIGSKKIAIFEDTQPLGQKLSLMDIELTQTQASPLEFGEIQKGEVVYESYETPDELLALEAKAFLTAARTGGSLPNDGHNGLHVVRMLESVQKVLNQTVTPQASTAK
ncbi:MAG: Gfo/Idh/MocA family oxidoreductase, partial [Cyanobacteria bacterium]|nr:Gfo/Idh/MocA family oxidoreductase [Cyanobacteriota bacterium]